MICLFSLRCEQERILDSIDKMDPPRSRAAASTIDSAAKWMTASSNHCLVPHVNFLKCNFFTFEVLNIV